MIIETYEDVIVISGSLKSNQWDTIHTAISLNLRRHPQGVILDCSGLVDANEAGIETFRSVMKFLEGHDARVIVASVPPQISEVLRKVSDVRSQLPIAANVEEARKSLYFFTDGEVEDEDHKKKKPSSTIRSNYSFLVVVNANECDKHVVSTAREMAEGLQASVHLVYPLIVPRHLPLQSVLAEEEELALRALRANSKVFEREELPFEMHLERGREIAATIEDAAERVSATHIIIGLPDEEHQNHDLGMVRTMRRTIRTAIMIFVATPTATN